jgi:hypothetical protein
MINAFSHLRRLCLVDDDAFSDVSVGKQQQTKDSMLSNIFFFFFCSNNKEKKIFLIMVLIFIRVYVVIYLYISVLAHARESRLTVGETKKK